MHRSREDFADLPLRLERTALGYLLVVRAEWLTGSPLTAASLHDEVRLWSAIGIELKLRTQRAAAGAAG